MTIQYINKTKICSHYHECIGVHRIPRVHRSKYLSRGGGGGGEAASQESLPFNVELGSDIIMTSSRSHYSLWNSRPRVFNHGPTSEQHPTTLLLQPGWQQTRSESTAQSRRDNPPFLVPISVFPISASRGVNCKPILAPLTLSMIKCMSFITSANHT